VLDAEQALYSGGFFTQNDKLKMEEIRALEPEQLADIDWKFEDSRLNTLLFTYKARHFPNTLSYKEQMKWQEFRRAKLADSGTNASIKAEEFVIEIERLAQDNSADNNKVALLKSLYDYGASL
jgi:exodeoxyribonuclease-1